MISVIIPAKDAASTISDCLRGVLSQKGLQVKYEVIVVDDGSTDQTAKIAEDFGVKVIQQENAGPSAARNTGAKIARGNVLAFTDSDCAPSPEWLKHLTEPFNDPEVVGTKGTYRTNQTRVVPRFVQQEYGFKYIRMAQLETIDFIDTYSAAYRRDVFLENGGFDQAFSVPSVEDQELAFRLARKGYRLVFVPDAIVYHRHDLNIGEYVRRKFGIGFWKAFMLRWLPEKSFSDSHTPPTLRWQIFLLALFLLTTTFVIFFWIPGWWLPLFPLVFFYLSALPFTVHIALNDRGVLQITPLMLLLRASGLGFGLSYGLVFPPRTKPRTHTGLSPLERGLKRGMDILGALVGLVIFIPVILISGLAIRLDSQGQVIFSQERVGENGKSFRVYKLRTTVQGTEGQLMKGFKKPLNEPVYKFPDDPRITRVGKFIRRWSLDELPQLWNVLKGEMSLVGPRPEQPGRVALYNDSQRVRLVVKPGLTGLMQLSGQGELDMETRLALDIDYINHYSIWRDIKIILKTIPAVIAGRSVF